MEAMKNRIMIFMDKEAFLVLLRHLETSRDSIDGGPLQDLAIACDEAYTNNSNYELLSESQVCGLCGKPCLSCCESGSGDINDCMCPCQ